MELINKDFTSLTKAQFEETLAGLGGLSLIVAPLILKASGGEPRQQALDQAASFAIDMQIAHDAVLEIKQQLFGVEDDE